MDWWGNVCKLTPLSVTLNTGATADLHADRQKHWPVWGKVSRSMYWVQVSVSSINLEKKHKGITLKLLAGQKRLWGWILSPLLYLHSLPHSTETGQMNRPLVWGLSVTTSGGGGLVVKTLFTYLLVFTWFQHSYSCLSESNHTLLNTWMIRSRGHGLTELSKTFLTSGSGHERLLTRNQLLCLWPLCKCSFTL